MADLDRLRSALLDAVDALDADPVSRETAEPEPEPEPVTVVGEDNTVLIDEADENTDESTTIVVAPEIVVVAATEDAAPEPDPEPVVVVDDAPAVVVVDDDPVTPDATPDDEPPTITPTSEHWSRRPFRRHR